MKKKMPLCVYLDSIEAVVNFVSNSRMVSRVEVPNTLFKDVCAYLNTLDCQVEITGDETTPTVGLFVRKNNIEMHTFNIP